MTEQNNSTTRTKPITRIFIGLGICVVAAGIYVMNGVYGNQTIETNRPVASETTKKRAIIIEASAQGDVAAMLAVDEPRQVPDHQFIAPDGSIKTIGDFKGKVLLVNLWATWCAPCREEMPAISDLQAQKSGEDFDVLTINIDRGGREKPEGFLNEIGVDNLPLYQDASMGIFNNLKKEGIAFGLPVTMLLDEDGFILASMNGPAHWSGDDALNYIDAAIASKDP
ncbi:thiol:disulfide interchange protein TlpA [Lentilitoribacter sp. EG35]|uniref:thiol:disulfide interchange protein TlpA n=1 Tax=Lentilitoribacter sp. EG35 TaxID=3234192 RepID=UPI00345F2481